MKFVLSTFLFTLIGLFCNVYPHNCKLTGKVEDASSKEPLIGVNIFINELDGVGTSTDINGNFRKR